MPITSVQDAIAVAKGYITEVFLDEGVIQPRPGGDGV